MSEPKIQSHHEKGKAGCPVPFASPRNSGSHLLLLTGGEGKGKGTIGYLFLPSRLERKRALGQKMKRGFLKALNLVRDYLGIGAVGLLASYPGVFISHPGQSVKYKARGKMKTELSVLEWFHPTACPPQHHSSAFLFWGVSFPCLESLWPSSPLS